MSVLVFPQPRALVRSVPPLRVVVAEPCRGTRRALVAAITRDHRFAVVAEAADGGEALNQLERLAPDLVVLPVTMPRLSGTEVVEALGGASSFTVIWTSTPRFAGVRALSARSTEHLELPVDTGRLARALERAFDDCNGRREQAEPPAAECQELTVKTLAGSWQTLPTADIERVRSAGRYAEIVTRDAVVGVRASLRTLASRLGRDFVWRGRAELERARSAELAPSRASAR